MSDQELTYGDMIEQTVQEFLAIDDLPDTPENRLSILYELKYIVENEPAVNVQEALARSTWSLIVLVEIQKAKRKLEDSLS